jgi:hypothetical protein
VNSASASSYSKRTCESQRAPRRQRVGELRLHAEVGAHAERVALHPEPGELGLALNAQLGEGQRGAGDGKRGRVEALAQLEARVAEHRTAADGQPARDDLDGDVRLHVDGLQRRLLRREAADEVVLPLRREPVGHVRGEPQRDAFGRAARPRAPRNGGNSTGTSPG